MTDAYYQDIRGRSRELLDDLRSLLTPADVAQVRELIEANEFGVALEWILDALIETRAPVAATALAKARALGERMEATEITPRIQQLAAMSPP